MASYIEFVNLCLGLALTGVSCLGFVLPSALKSNPAVLAGTFSVVVGALLAIIAYFAPLKVNQDGIVSIDLYLSIQSCTFLLMFAADHSSGLSILCSINRLNDYFTSIIQEHRAVISYNADNQHNSPRSPNIQFSQLQTEDCVFDEQLDESTQASPGIEVIATGGSSALRKEAYSVYILVFSGMLLEYSKGVYLTSRRTDISYLDTLKYLSYNLLIAYSISAYLITVKFYSRCLTNFLIMLAVSPLLAAILLETPFSIKYDVYADGIFTSFYCGSALYWISMCLIPSAVYRHSKEDETGQMFLVLLGFGITYCLGSSRFLSREYS